MNDVVPAGPDGWLARCECGATAPFTDQSDAWEWVLSHPCPDELTRIDLTERQDARHN